MKFVFPQNYKFQNKLLGVMDYPTVIVNLVWYAIVSFLLSFLPFSFSLKIFLFITFCFPLLLFSFAGFHGENILLVSHYMLKFVLKQKLYLYQK